LAAELSTSGRRPKLGEVAAIPRAVPVTLGGATVLHEAADRQPAIRLADLSVPQRRLVLALLAAHEASKRTMDMAAPALALDLSPAANLVTEADHNRCGFAPRTCSVRGRPLVGKGDAARSAGHADVPAP
jgi:hypothetical protein